MDALSSKIQYNSDILNTIYQLRFSHSHKYRTTIQTWTLLTKVSDKRCLQTKNIEQNKFFFEQKAINDTDNKYAKSVLYEDIWEYIYAKFFYQTNHSTCLRNSDKSFMNLVITLLQVFQFLQRVILLRNSRVQPHGQIISLFLHRLQPLAMRLRIRLRRLLRGGVPRFQLVELLLNLVCLHPVFATNLSQLHTS